MIKNIIFDFGGVLYDIDYDLTVNKLAEHSTVNNDLLTLDEMLEIPDHFERGLVSEADFRKNLRITFGIYDISDSELDSIWNLMLIGIKIDSLEFIKAVKQNFNVALLSNTNSIHYDKFHNETNELEKQINYVFFSHLIKMRKPDIEIYNYVCNSCGFIPEETLFIDDNLINVNGAISANLKTFHCARNGELSDLINTIKIITHT